MEHIFKKITAIGLSLVLTVLMSGIQFADAASLTLLSDTLSSNKKSTLSSHVIKFSTPTGASDASDTIIITFPSDYNFTSKTIGSVTFTHGASTGLESTETLAASPSGTAWGAVFSGTQNRILTLTAPSDGIGSATVAAGDKIIITYNSTNSTNPTTAGSYITTIAGTFGDTGSITVPILDDDQVVVSATVDQSITFTISDSTIGFGSLSSAAAKYATGDTTGTTTEAEAHNLVVGTNASNGYTLTLAGSTLTSGSSTITAIGTTNTASSVGTEQFGVRLTATGGSGAVASPYAASGFAFDSAAFPDTIATSTVATSNTTYSARYIANIGAQTEAGAYSATLNYVATANF